MTENAAISEPSRDRLKAKKKRLRGACDACRIRKTKCDSAESPMNICSSCIANKVRCRHEMPRYQKLIDRHEEAIEYISSLQERIQKLEDYIYRAHPGEDIDSLISQPPHAPPSNVPGPSADTGSYPPILLSYPKDCSLVITMTTPPSNTQDESDGLEADEIDERSLSEDLKKLTTSDAAEARFFGQASSAMLAKHVTDVKKEITGDFTTSLNPSKYRRPIYWGLSPWEDLYVNDPETVYIYPEYDLLMELVSLYFQKVNTLIPILHYPTFMEMLAAGQHHWDLSFGMVVLMVCAHGAKYSQDPRVVVADDSVGLSAGWKYFSQIPLHRKQLLYKSTLYDLQYYALASMFMVGTSMPYACWNLAVIGLRYAYEKGIHRRRSQNHAPTVESELLKRAFWALVCIDSCSSSFVGRPCTMHETHDVEYPIECDDEYWETGDPETAFRQPQGKPCSITAFICFIRLCEILGFALRTLYANKKSRILLGFIGADWEEKMVAELDSTMNKWSEDLPKYLEWDPDKTDSPFFHQTVNLHLSYYYIQIQIHRPYLTKRSPLTLPSLAMCNNAARSCTRILEASLAGGTCVLPNALSIAYTAGMVITFSLLAVSRSNGKSSASREDMENLQKCINYLKTVESRWYASGKLLDSLMEAGDFPTINTHVPCAQEIPTPQQESAEIIPNTNEPVSSSEQGQGFTNGWELQKLLLIEMGYLPNQSTPMTDTSNAFPPVQDSGLFTSLDSWQPLTLNNTGNSSQIPQSTLATFSDGTNFFDIEEWNRYLSHMGR